MSDERNETERMTLSMGGQLAPLTAERVAEAELCAAAMTFAAVGMMGNAELTLQAVGLARKARAEDGATMEISTNEMDVAVTDLEAAALAYAEAKGYRKP
jgi:hypothetical protein